jgi:8-amino-7-oxononanoate synthase
MHPKHWRERLVAEAELGLRRHLPNPASLAPGTIDCGSNDYLGLSRHPLVVAAAHAALDEYGSGATASRLLRGNRAIHEELEADLARLKGTEAALVFSSGYAANLGLLSAVCDRDDTVLCDRLDHASLIDGARLSRASLRFFAHGDVDHLERQLGRVRSSGHTFVVTDGVFSMDGLLAPLPALREVTDRHGATLVVDDAHATGVVGVNGAGTLSHFDMEAGGVIQVGTLSKALGAQGGYVAGSKELIDLLVQRARAFIYSTGLGPSAAAAARVALQVVVDEPVWRERLHRNLEMLRSGLEEANKQLYGLAPAPMCAVHVGSARDASRVASELEQRGIIAPAIRPPTVPDGTSRIRLAPTAGLNGEDVERVVNAVVETLPD